MHVPFSSLPDEATSLWSDVQGHKFEDRLTESQSEALEMLSNAHYGVKKELGAVGLRTIIERAYHKPNAYFVLFANPPGVMSIAVHDGSYATRSRLTGLVQEMEVLEYDVSMEPYTLTAHELLLLMGERGVVAAALPPLVLGSASLHGRPRGIALATCEDEARVAMQACIGPHESLPMYMGTWKDWGVGLRSVGDVAFGTTMEESTGGEMVAFELEERQALNVTLPEGSAPEPATLLVGRRVPYSVGSPRVYALAIDRFAMPVQAAKLYMIRRSDGTLCANLPLTTIPPWARGARKGEVVQTFRTSSHVRVVEEKALLGKRKHCEA
jgi:hypothetical protein